jgi:hypothetical protein
MENVRRPYGGFLALNLRIYFSFLYNPLLLLGDEFR